MKLGGNYEIKVQLVAPPMWRNLTHVILVVEKTGAPGGNLCRLGEKS